MVLAAGISNAVFHWYSGPPNILDKIISNGFFISATPALAYSLPHREAVERAPLSHILVETDAPEKYQGKVSEPAMLIETIEYLSRIKNMPPLEAGCITAANALSFYGLQKDGNDFS
jgi:TatD DNase family protein